MPTQNKDQQVKDLKNAIAKVVAIGPEFLAKKIPPEEMAHTMINAVEDYVKKAKADNTLHPQTQEAANLQEALQELMGCGSGYLADRCDAACVARTINYMVKEFPEEKLKK